MAVVVIAGLGAGVFFVLPQLSSGTSGQPSASSGPKGNLETCKGFLLLDEVKSATGESGLVLEITRSKELGGNPPIGADAHCAFKFQNPDGSKTLNVHITLQESDSLAIGHYRIFLPPPRDSATKMTRGFLGENSRLLEVNDNDRGSSAIFQSDRYVVQIWTTLTGGVLTDVDQLADFARLIKERLPEAPSVTEAPEQPAVGELDFETCTGFFESADIEDITGISNVEFAPNPIEGSKICDILIFSRADALLAIFVWEMRTDNAEDRYLENLRASRESKSVGPEFYTLIEGVVGENSHVIASTDVENDIKIYFQVGKTWVSLRTDPNNPILSNEQVIDIAKLLKEKLST